MRKFMGKVGLEAGLVAAVLACVAVLIHEMPPRGMVHSAEQHMQR